MTAGRPDHETLAGVHAIVAGSAGEFGIRCYRSEAVSGHIDLGHDLNESVRGVLYEFTNLILRVEAAVVLGFVGCGWREGAEGAGLLHAPGTDFGELWQRFYFDAPALVVGE